MLVFIDLELTGVAPYDEMCEYAAMMMSGKVLANNIFSTLEEMSPKMSRLTGIENSQLAGGIDFTEWYRKHDFDYVAASFSLQHDVNWISHTAKLNGLPPPTIKGICLMEMFCLAHPEIKYPTLESALTHLMSPSKKSDLDAAHPPHRALNDAVRHRELFAHMIKEGFDKLKLPSLIKTFSPSGIA